MLSLGAAVGVGVGVASSVAAVIALAWVRLRRCGHSPPLTAQQQQQQEMEWDNSTFSITVNPLDCDDGFDGSYEEFDREAVPVTVQVSDDLEPSGDELDVETAGGKPGGKELEWDDSTLSY